jgi:hypothetical protein
MIEQIQTRTWSRNHSQNNFCSPRIFRGLATLNYQSVTVIQVAFCREEYRMMFDTIDESACSGGKTGRGSDDASSL